jgi:hypothetical protein
MPLVILYLTSLLVKVLPCIYPVCHPELSLVTALLLAVLSEMGELSLEFQSMVNYQE